MSQVTCPDKAVFVLERKHFQTLLDALTEDGYRLLGPTVRDGAVVYDKVCRANDFPIGWTDVQEAGEYSLVKGKRKTLFNYTVGPQTWKKFLLPPVEQLWEAVRADGSFKITRSTPDESKLALIGVRSCETSALSIHRKIFTQGPHIDQNYRQRHGGLFIVAVNCVQAGGTCFCVSMQTGPKVSSGFDLALTEVCSSRQHYFLVEVGSSAGKKLVKRLPVREAKTTEIAAVEKALQRSAAQMGRTLDSQRMKKTLEAKLDNPHWEKVAERCLSCGSCTMVCPTCFCTGIEDNTDLTGRQAFRLRRWDSCFAADFTYIHGGSIRKSDASRYRQWMMHKLVYHQDQFGIPGCVGCGRCITWCPVGIDITEEAGKLMVNV